MNLHKVYMAYMIIKDLQGIHDHKRFSSNICIWYKIQIFAIEENVLATQAFTNPENISKPQTGIEPATFWSPVGRSNYWATKTQMAERRLRYVLVRKWHTYS